MSYKYSKNGKYYYSKQYRTWKKYPYILYYKIDLLRNKTVQYIVAIFIRHTGCIMTRRSGSHVGLSSSSWISIRESHVVGREILPFLALADERTTISLLSMKKVERYRKHEVKCHVSLPASVTFDSIYTWSSFKIWDTIYLIASRRADRSIRSCATIANSIVTSSHNPVTHM